ncbi:hypothetical protein PVAG01_00595 [Phlyctema vagabunda]|uniref:ABM domain-containing protein n=1 Tax=Phlyctema vagabunda TaxID=108571 RepID=A0ABR4PW41_9HELO
MASPTELIAIIVPKPGKADRVIELLLEVSKYVVDNEPDTLKYHIHLESNKKTGVEEVIILETYKDKKALAAHGESAAFKNLEKKLTEEDLVAAPLQLKFIKPVGGFASRL